MFLDPPQNQNTVRGGPSNKEFKYTEVPKLVLYQDIEGNQMITQNEDVGLGLDECGKKGKSKHKNIFQSKDLGEQFFFQTNLISPTKRIAPKLRNLINALQIT